MIVEYIRYRVPESRSAEFEEAYTRAAVPLAAAPQCVDYELSRCVEEAGTYILRITWTSAEAHLREVRTFSDRTGAPVVTHVADSPVFKRKGDHLEVEVPLTIPEALRGGEIEVPTLNGRKRLRVPPGTKHGTVQRLRGEGPPKLSGRGRGDIHYRLAIDVPRSLSREQREAVDDLAAALDGNPRERLLTGRR